jgi:hypothetical protein
MFYDNRQQEPRKNKFNYNDFEEYQEEPRSKKTKFNDSAQPPYFSKPYSPQPYSAQSYSSKPYSPPQYSPQPFKKPKRYAIEKEGDEFEAWYHADNICGSSFNGLATTLQKYAQNDQITLGLNQIDKCIKARLTATNKIQPTNNTHNKVIDILEDLRQKYSSINDKHFIYSASLDQTLIRFDNQNHKFIITIGGQIIGGKKCKKLTKKRKKITKKCKKLTKKTRKKRK